MCLEEKGTNNLRRDEMKGEIMKIEREKKFIRQRWRDGKVMDKERKQRIKEKGEEEECRRISKKEKDRKKNWDG